MDALSLSQKKNTDSWNGNLCMDATAAAGSYKKIFMFFKFHAFILF